jgi:FkbM family methyltransferase
MMQLILTFGSKIIRKLFKLFGLKISRPGPYEVFDFQSFLYRYLETHKTLVFIQIGANDGVMNDPIYEFNVKNSSAVSGYVLEPLPEAFSNLVKNYATFPRIRPLNLAIHNTQEEMLLYQVKPEYFSMLPEFARGIASFDSEHWKKTLLVPDSTYLQSTVVKCITFPKLLQEYHIGEIDLLLIDTEGYDFHILMHIDFERFKPRMIRFEHGVRNEIMTHVQFLTVCERLNSYGYQIIAESYDATAYLLDPNDLIF